MPFPGLSCNLRSINEAEAESLGYKVTTYYLLPRTRSGDRPKQLFVTMFDRLSLLTPLVQRGIIIGVGEKEWFNEFNPQNRIRIHFVTERGQVVQIFVVQYEALIGGQWHAVVRYDNAHGFFHRDVLLPGGRREKMAIPGDDLAAALTEAIEDLKRQWPYYRRQFEEGLYELDKQ